MICAEKCPRNTKCTPLSNVVADNGSSFVCVGYHGENKKDYHDIIAVVDVERGREFITGSRQSNIPVVTNHVCRTCKGTRLAYIDEEIGNTLCPDC